MCNRMAEEGDGMAEQEEKKGALGDFSLSTVVASSLAAVTSFLLSSKIGLAGSLIGVAVAAAASAVASQLYKALIKASAQKIKDELGEGGPSPAPLGEGARVAPAELRAAAARRSERRALRRAVAFVAGVAIGAVLIYAGVVVLATSGRGIGASAPELSSTPAEQTGGATSENAPEWDTQAEPEQVPPSETSAPKGDPEAAPKADPQAPKEDEGAQATGTAKKEPVPDGNAEASAGASAGAAESSNSPSGGKQ